MNTFSTDVIEALQQPLDAAAIKYRRGGGNKLLKYIKGDYAIDTANRIFGFGAWGYTVISRGHEIIEDGKKGKMEYYTCDVELQVQGCAFPFPGDGIGIVTSPCTVEMHEKARKEATTDALKRALRHYGDQFGLALYNEDDYVLDEGTLVQVRDIHPSVQQGQPKRIIEGSTMQKLPVASSFPTTPEKSGRNGVQGQGEALEGQVNGTTNTSDETRKQRLNVLFCKARDAGLFTPRPGTAKADFLAWLRNALDRDAVTEQDITVQMLTELEQYVEQEEGEQ